MTSTLHSRPSNQALYLQGRGKRRKRVKRMTDKELRRRIGCILSRAGVIGGFTRNAAIEEMRQQKLLRTTKRKKK